MVDFVSGDSEMSDSRSVAQRNTISLVEGRLWFVPVSLTMHAQNVFKNGTVNGQRHRDEILAPYVVPYAGAVVQEFILMDDNATAHCCLIE